MERKVEICLDDNKNILIKIDSSVMYAIVVTERQITADIIYTILNPKLKDTYKLEEYIDNEKFDKDNDVAKYFHELIKDITDGINLLNKEDDSQDIIEPSETEDSSKDDLPF